MYNEATNSAYNNVNSSEKRKWSVPSDNPTSERAEGDHGGARIFGDLTTSLDFHPRFRVDRSSSIFTIGSCFARNVEEALLQEGFTVLTRSGHFPYAHGYLNRYNTPTMIQELEYAFDVRSFDPASIVAMRSGYSDLTSNGTFSNADEVRRHRQITTELFKSMAQAGLIIITAGLSEVWFDKKYGTFTNFSPSEAGRQEPDRFEFRVLDYATNLKALESLVNLARIVVPGCQIMMTVSPVPLNATFVKRDVLISNAYSKSCLRAAVEEIYWKYEFVDYFPSFEMVTLSDPAIVWESDRRHVRPDFVKKIMREFVRRYINTESMA